MSRWIVVETTAEDAQVLRQIAKALVRERLAACAQIGGPVESHYFWKEQVQEAQEFRLSLKTSLELYPEVERRLIELHPYDVPQVIAVPLTRLSGQYEQWLTQSLKDPDRLPRSTES